MHISLEERGLLLLSTMGSPPRASPHVPILRKEWNCILLEEMLTIWPVRPCARGLASVLKQQRSRGRLGRCVLISMREEVQMVGYR